MINLVLALCGISSASSLFAKIPVSGLQRVKYAEEETLDRYDCFFLAQGPELQCLLRVKEDLS